ncbi:hypothetical protein LEMLEM_LOCUS4868, partial [Lemmus lemmus]
SWKGGLEEAGGPGWLFWSVWEKLPGFLAWWTGPRPTWMCGPGSCRQVKPAASAAYLAGSEMYRGSVCPAPLAAASLGVQMRRLSPPESSRDLGQ